MEFKVGQTHRAFIGISVYKIYILAIVDNNMVFYKHYGKHKQLWHYTVEDAETVQMRIDRATEKESKK